MSYYNQHANVPRTTCDLVLFYHVDPRVIRPGGKCLYPLSHLSGFTLGLLGCVTVRWRGRMMGKERAQLLGLGTGMWWGL